MRYLQGSIPYFAGLVTEDRAQQSFLCGHLGLTLRGYLSDKDITGSYFRTDADDSAVVQIL